MFTNTKLALVLSAATFWFGATAMSVYAQDPADQLVNARHEATISATYSLNPYLQGDEIHVKVQEGKVELTGSVDDEVRKDLAKQIALGVEGITSVDNNLLVDSDRERAVSESTERSFAEVVEDASITAAVKSKLMWSRQHNALDVTVETHTGVVTLTGTAGSSEARAMAVDLAMDTRGVVSVDNQLTIDSTMEIADEAAGSFGQSVSDTWITTKVKSTYAMSSNVTGRDISVTTANGIVTLTGTVDSGEERELAVQLAKNINGVNEVIATALLEKDRQVSQLDE